MIKISSISRKFLCISCLFFSTSLCFSQQPENLSKLVNQTMQLLRQGEYWSGLSPFRNYIKDSAQAMITAFKPYTSDSLENIRSLAYDAIAVSGQKATNLQTRQLATDILVDGCRDKEASMRKNVAGQLEHFLKSDFTESAKQKLASLLKMESQYFQNTVKLIGFLEINSEIPVLKAMLDSGQIKNRTLEWDVRLCLARLNSKDDINYCVDMVKKKGLNDKIIYNLFPDLTYTRSKEAIDYMLEVLNRDAKDCFSPNPDNPVQISCAYRVMEFLAPIIMDFPLKKDKDGELEIEDYEKGLITCRAWFKKHLGDYEVNRDRF